MRSSLTPSVALSRADADHWKRTMKKFEYSCGDNHLYAYSPEAAAAELVAARRLVVDSYVMGWLVAQATTPPAVTDAVAGFGRPGGPDAMVIDLGPEFIGPDPAQHMPVDGRRNTQKLFGPDDVAQLAFVQACGATPFSLVPEAGLDLIMPVSPAPGREATRSSKGGGSLGWHVDNMPFARNYRPDFFALTGLVSTEPVPTRYALVDDILEALRRREPAAEQTLRKPLYQFRTPASFHFDGSEQQVSPLIPVIEDGPDGRAVINYNEYSLVRDHAEPDSTAALNALTVALADKAVMREEWLSPGKTLLVSNTRAVHARGEIRGRRYLGRLYARWDLTALRSLPSGGDVVYRFRFPMSPGEIAGACTPAV